MGTTGKGFRYPQYSDTPDVPRDLSYLAADVDAYLDAHPGPQGPAATIQIGTITTVASTVPAAVTNVGTETDAIFNFTLPRGVDGIIGGDGPAGPSNVLQIGTVQTGAAGSSAVATITGTSPSQTLNFVIPKGDTGATGATGPQGPKGDAAATINVGSTTTGAAGTNASVTNSGTSSAVVLNFTIPRGATGATGPQGPAGADGAAATLDPINGLASFPAPIPGSSYGVNSNWFPVANNYVSIGQPIDAGLGVTTNKFWKTIYSNTGTINTSDLRLKTDIQDSTLGLDFINSLRPVSYKFIEGGRDQYGDIIPGSRTHWGLIAQEVKSVIDTTGVEDFAGWVLLDKSDSNSEQALRYEEFIAPLIKAVQELTARVEALEA
jgi:Chaperone of endosialidase